MEACCTCARLLSAVPRYSETSEKPVVAVEDNRRLDCCGRVICGQCLHGNERFATYCPYCQISSSESSNRLLHGLRQPPSYVAVAAAEDPYAAAPPPYSTVALAPPASQPRQGPDAQDEKTALAESAAPAEDTLHFLDHNADTIASLSLRYGVPAAVLRTHNRLTSDHLLPGRGVVSIPGTHYKGGVSLSPRPVGGEEEEARKARIRRWMVATKCPDYDVAVLYLEQAGDDIDLALERWWADERWERENPVGEGGGRAGKGKGKRAGNLRSNGPWARQAAFLRSSD